MWDVSPVSCGINKPGRDRIAHAAPETNRGSKWKLRIAILAAVLVVAIAIAFHISIEASRDGRFATIPPAMAGIQAAEHLERGMSKAAVLGNRRGVAAAAAVGLSWG
jgi:hypothetical protein